jgi:hypothetical protein
MSNSRITQNEINKAVAKYSILADGNQLLASKYAGFLSSEDEPKAKREHQSLNNIKGKTC